MAKTLVLILGDQLSPGISALRDADLVETVILITEVADEAGYVPHHKKKLAFVFSAMRHFAQELREAQAGRSIMSRSTIRRTAARCQAKCGARWRRHGLSRNCWPPNPANGGCWTRCAAGRIDLEMLPDDRFLADRAGFAAWAEGRKGLRMEHFYRLMRRKTGLLMDGAEPAGGRWNFDADNRAAPRRTC
jgi:deoxyribodipyrimidine photolyase-related protein